MAVRDGHERHFPRARARARARGGLNPPYPTLVQQSFNGRETLVSVLASSVFRTPAQATASLSAFTHPETVAQIPGGGALFAAVRDGERRRTLGIVDGVRVGFDDNETVHQAFRWCNPGLPRWKDVQLNHIWPRSDDWRAFTAPANLAAAPSFLAKLTDHDAEIATLLRYRAFDLYGWAPADEREPACPPGYGALVWADPLPATPNLEATLRARLRAKPKCTAALIAREIGWAFSGFAPDPSI
jgi:hypothetical protein